MNSIRKAPEERRKEILNTSQRLFKEKGFSNVTIKDITSDVGIARTTFYEYYTDKIEILVDLVDKVILMKANEDPNGNTCYEKLMSIAKEVFTIIEANRHIYYLILTETPVLSSALGNKLLEWQNARYQVTMSVIQEAIDHNELNDNISAQDAVFIFLALLGQQISTYFLLKLSLKLKMRQREL